MSFARFLEASEIGFFEIVVDPESGDVLSLDLESGDVTPLPATLPAALRVIALPD